MEHAKAQLCVPAARSRPGSAVSSAPCIERAQGKPGAGCTRIAVCEGLLHKMHTDLQVQPRHPGFPRAMALRLMSCSSRGAAFLAPVADGKISHRRSARVAAPEPHDFAVRREPPRRGDRSVHRIPRPTCRDDGDTPLLAGADGCQDSFDLQNCQAFLPKIRIDVDHHRCGGNSPASSSSRHSDRGLVYAVACPMLEGRQEKEPGRKPR